MSTRATVTINEPTDREQVIRWARNVELGTVVTFRKKSRSTEQSAKMWAMLHEIAEQVEWYGAKLEAEDWKDMATASLRHARVVPGIDRGTYVPLGMHTSTMTIEEMTNLIEFLYAFGAEHGVVFKDPKETTEPGSSPHHEPDADEAPSPASSADIDESPSSSISPIPDASTPDGGPASGEDPAGGETAPSQPPAGSTLSSDQRAKLIEAAGKFMKLAQEQISFESRLAFLETREADWRDVIASENWPKLESLATAARAVINSKRTPAQAIEFMASVLECPTSAIGG